MIQSRFLGLFGGQDQRPRPRQESNRKWLMKGSNWSNTKEIILVSCFWKWYLDHLHLSVFDPGHKLFRRLKWLYMAGYMSEALPISFHININPIFCQSWPYNQKLNCCSFLHDNLSGWMNSWHSMNAGHHMEGGFTELKDSDLEKVPAC